MNLWMEIVHIASTISFREDEDVLICQINTSGLHFSQSLYRVINFLGFFSLQFMYQQFEILRSL